ncbi:dTDP-4-dehydrorhamnose reductase [Clostridium chromiireducens]|uniref:dTDP-4-dehydrorhamnose reductase n=1 Tax=Clostridium chromiireducens TaxID=225345 RepID=A0A399IW08_9CLOT|nr:dTDP-4-dehydrorhamnose reductase [Clostridium chromiireducens]RII36657.1 dTDP-4-dehydrorhamnose reductase [Clostridium chromiireducens]
MVLVTGVNGQLGYDIVKELDKRGIDSKGIDIQDLDLTNKTDVINFITDLKPTCVIHCAGYTQVDKAEIEDGETKKCFDINYRGTEYIAIACKDLDIKMVYISTDYVFDGTKTGEYEISDNVNPLSKYGMSKMQGERAILEHLNKYFIIRTSWLFGLNGNNFINTMINLGKEKEVIDVVFDQLGSPTYTVDLACLICDVVETNKYGIYHATNEGFCSWADLAKKVLEIKNISCKINPISSKEYKSVTIRPLNSRLSKRSLESGGFSLLPNWEDAVKRYLLSKDQRKEV